MRTASPTEPRPARRTGDESGLTLIELMFSFFLLSIILAAVAGSLITFTRATVDNERRVQATALMNRLHEELQSIPWFDAAVYEEELGPLLDATTGIEGELGGRDLVTLEGPSLTGCATTDPAYPDCNRREQVPRAYFTTEVDGIDYEVFQAVTWADSAEELKRFTTVVRWSLLDRDYEERFESERAATAAETGDPTLPRVIQFQVGPSPMALNAASPGPLETNSQDIEVVVRFSQPVDSASLRFYSVSSTPTDASGNVQLGLRTLGMTPEVYDPSGKPIEFRTTIAAGSYRFPNGTRIFRVTGLLGSDSFSGSTSMAFTDGGLEPTPDPDAEEGTGGGQPVVPTDPEADPPGTPVTVGPVAISPTLVCRKSNGDLESDVLVSVTVEGMTADDYNVAATYTAGEAKTTAMVPRTPTAISEAGATFDLAFPRNQDHGFVTGPSGQVTTSFTIVATRAADGASAQRTSELQLTVRDRQKGSC